MGFPGKRDEPIRAGITAIVFMNRLCDELVIKNIHNDTQELLADYPVFLVSRAILNVKIRLKLLRLRFYPGFCYWFAAGN